MSETTTPELFMKGLKDNPSGTVATWYRYGTEQLRGRPRGKLCTLSEDHNYYDAAAQAHAAGVHIEHRLLIPGTIAPTIEQMNNLRAAHKKAHITTRLGRFTAQLLQETSERAIQAGPRQSLDASSLAAYALLKFIDPSANHYMGNSGFWTIVRPGQPRIPGGGNPNTVATFCNRRNPVAEMALDGWDSDRATDIRSLAEQLQGIITTPMGSWRELYKQPGARR